MLRLSHLHNRLVSSPVSSSSSRPTDRLARLVLLGFALLAWLGVGGKAYAQITCPQPHDLYWKFLGETAQSTPDGTVMAPGTSFHKEWILQNCGRLGWYTAQADLTADSTFGPKVIPFPAAASLDIFVVKADLIAPSRPGLQRATYTVQANGVPLDSSFWAEIDVTGGGTFTLSVGISGSGTVTSSPGGISCSSPLCSASFASGTSVTLTPTPGTGYLFAGWSGNPDCSDGVVLMNADRNCQASFVPDTGLNHVLTVNKTGTGSGTVTGPGIDCGSTCTALFPSGTPVVLHASPDPGSQFAGWSGDCDSGGGVTMDADHQCTASFGTSTGLPGLDLSATPSTVTLNGQGWPANNPVTVSVTASCPGACDGNLVLNIGIATVGGAGARFYRYDSSPTPGCTLTDDDLDNRFSATAVYLDCPLSFPSGGSASYQFKLWMQPSSGGVMPVKATWKGLERVAPVTVPAAQIHPVVLIHGILGSMGPKELLVQSRDQARTVFDPFLGHYWPILDTLMKMGYEWNKSLFGLAYDWRKPNEQSAEFLKTSLRTVVSRAGDVSYVEPKADLLVHSMGGLVSRYYIQDSGYEGNVRKVIFVASPHKGFPFDYRTWEGMTWSDYVYNAPPIPIGGPLFTLTMDKVLWPTLIAKRYKPGFADTLSCTDVGEVPPPILLTGNAVFLVGHPLPTVLACPLDLVEGWAKNGDADHGIGSLKQMLPTEDSPPYLYSYFTGAPNPQGHEVNTFLESLNANVSQLVDHLGADNIYVLAGKGAPETDKRYDVLPHVFGNSWQYGSVTRVIEQTAGDDLIPLRSATLDSSGLVPLPSGHEVILDASPNPDGARHSPLMHHDKVQRIWVPTFLADQVLPFKTDYAAPDLIPDQAKEILLVSLECPVDVTITDPLGRKLSYDSRTHTLFNEIPHSLYVSPGSEPQVIWIGAPELGQYEVKLTGWEQVGPDPNFLVRADRIWGAVGPVMAAAGATSPGREHTYTFDLVPNDPPTADAGPDQTVAAGADCTASVTLDGSGSSDPNGDTLHFTWESPFGTYEGMHPTLPLPLGHWEVKLTVDDGKGQAAHDSVGITVEDKTPPVITVPLRIVAEQTSRDGTPVSLPAPVVQDNCSLPTVTSDAPATFPLGETIVTYTAVDDAGNVAKATTAVLVRDTTPPVIANVPAPVTVEQESAAGTRVTLALPTATDICDAAPRVTSDAPAIFPLGRTTVTFTAVDASGNVATAKTTVTVVDTTPPVIQGLVANPSTLWPPNHKLVRVDIAASVVDVCDVHPRCRVVDVTSSDPVTGKGDNTTPDWVVDGDMSLQLRSERAGGGSGRIYTIAVRCTDASGNASARKTVTVRVPHDQGGGK